MLTANTSVRELLMANVRYSNRNGLLRREELYRWFAEFAPTIPDFSSEQDCPKVAEYFAEIICEFVVSSQMRIGHAVKYAKLILSDDTHRNMYMSQLVDSINKISNDPEIITRNEHMIKQGFVMQPMKNRKPAKVSGTSFGGIWSKEKMPMLMGILGRNYEEIVRNHYDSGRQ